jgi:hypothetical protein
MTQGAARKGHCQFSSVACNAPPLVSYTRKCFNLCECKLTGLTAVGKKLKFYSIYFAISLFLVTTGSENNPTIDLALQNFCGNTVCLKHARRRLANWQLSRTPCSPCVSDALLETLRAASAPRCYCLPQMMPRQHGLQHCSKEATEHNHCFRVVIVASTGATQTC